MNPEDPKANHPSTYRERDIHGVGAPGKAREGSLPYLREPEISFTNEFLAELAANTAKYESAPTTITLEEWMGFKEKSGEGLDPNLSKFLQANPVYFAANREEGDGITPRMLGGVSDLLTRSKNPTGSGYVVNKFLLDSFMTQKGADELLEFTKEQGFTVKTTHDFREQKLFSESSLKL